MIKRDYLLFIAGAFLSGFLAHWAIESVWWHQPYLAFAITDLSVLLAFIAVSGGEE